MCVRGACAWCVVCACVCWGGVLAAQVDYYFNGAVGGSRFVNGEGQGMLACAGVPGQAPGAACEMVNAVDGSLYVTFAATGYVLYACMHARLLRQPGPQLLWQAGP